MPDTNVVAYALIQGPRTALARRVLTLDPEWRVPDLWRHEFLNALATYVRFGGATVKEAVSLWLEATRLLEGCTEPVDMALALQLIVEHNIGAYDAQFIALALELGALCITEDRRILKAFPQAAMSMQQFSTAGGSPSRG
ncbi:MAG: type II toxin-antitoxin system VapC family toxin [Acidobacteriota bacterium]